MVEIPTVGMKQKLELWQLAILTFIVTAICGWILGIADSGKLADLAAALIITLICWRWIEILKS